jgi:hypothetical protein
MESASGQGPFYSETDAMQYSITKMPISIDRSSDRRMLVKNDAAEGGASLGGATGNILGSGTNTKFNINFPANCLLDWNNSYFIFKFKFGIQAGTAIGTNANCPNMAPYPTLWANWIQTFSCYLNRNETSPLTQITTNFHEHILARCLAYLSKDERNSSEDFLFGPWDDEAYTGSFGAPGGVGDANIYAPAAVVTQDSPADAAAGVAGMGPGIRSSIGLARDAMNQHFGDYSHSHSREALAGGSDAAAIVTAYNAHRHQVGDKTARVKRMERWMQFGETPQIICIPLWLMTGFKSPGDACLRNLRKLGFSFTWNPVESGKLEMVDGHLAAANQGYSFLQSVEFVSAYNVLSQTQANMLIQDRVSGAPDNLSWIDVSVLNREVSSGSDLVITNVSDLFSVMILKPVAGFTNGKDTANLVTYNNPDQLCCLKLPVSANTLHQRNALINTGNNGLTAQIFYSKSYPEVPISTVRDMTQLYQEYRKSAMALTGHAHISYARFCDTMAHIWLTPFVDVKSVSPHDLTINVVQNVDGTALAALTVYVCLWRLRALRILADGTVLVPNVTAPQ